MRIIIAIIAIALAALYGVSSSKRSELVGVWRTRMVHDGLELVGTLDLKESGEIVMNGSVTPLDTGMFLRGSGGPNRAPSRSFNFQAKGEWSVFLNALVAKFEESKPKCALPLDQLYGGKIVNIEARKFVLGPYIKDKAPAGMETETWYR